MTIIYNISSDGGAPTSAVAFIVESAEPLVANPGHPNFGRIIEALVRGEQDAQEVRDLFDTAKAISNQFAQLGEQVAIRGNSLYFDGDLINDVLASTIVDFYTEGNDNLLPLVKFMEKIATNPSENSRESLFAWMANKSFGLTEDGNILAYKSVLYHRVGDRTDGYTSINSGTATVNGVEQTGQIVQRVGDVVEMPRSNVNDNRGASCSTGLHIGTWGYISWFTGDCILQVEVNPRDVVSVPADSSEQKMRTCRYRVVQEVTEEFPSLFVEIDPVDSWDYDPAYDSLYDEDPECDEDLEEDFDLIWGDVEDVNDIDDEDERFDARQLELWGKTRDEIRSLAKSMSIARKDRNKDGLINAILDVEFP